MPQACMSAMILTKAVGFYYNKHQLSQWSTKEDEESQKKFRVEKNSSQGTNVQILKGETHSLLPAAI